MCRGVTLRRIGRRPGGGAPAARLRAGVLLQAPQLIGQLLITVLQLLDHAGHLPDLGLEPIRRLKLGGLREPPAWRLRVEAPTARHAPDRWPNSGSRKPALACATAEAAPTTTAAIQSPMRKASHWRCGMLVAVPMDW